MDRKVDVPLPILHRIHDVARDTRLSATAINTFAVLATYADENGFVGNDEHGHSMDEGASISRQLEAGASTVRKAMNKLEAFGYLRWDRTPGVVRSRPIEGSISKVRILFPEDQ